VHFLTSDSDSPYHSWYTLQFSARSASVTPRTSLVSEVPMTSDNVSNRSANQVYKQRRCFLFFCSTDFSSSLHVCWMQFLLHSEGFERQGLLYRGDHRRIYRESFRRTLLDRSHHGVETIHAGICATHFYKILTCQF